MPRFLLVLAAMLLIAGGSPAFACDVSPDAPELARAGPDPVGFVVVPVTVSKRPHLSVADLLSGRFTLSDKPLNVSIWYPAVAGTGEKTTYVGRVRRPGQPDAVFETSGCALKDAVPLKGAAPLVILSHGYGGWAAYTADLAETLASRGYVVAAIDHEDPPFHDAAGFAGSFAEVAANRARDQQAVIARLRIAASDPDFTLAGSYDPDRMALIGYSMGGFGALATAGAPYDPASALFRKLPGGLLKEQSEATVQPVAGLKALVLIAPWGGQPTNRSWTPTTLSRVKAPVLVIAGDQDDVVGYADGIQWIFAGLTGTDRFMLTFANARHNLVGADAPVVGREQFSSFESFEEPVWRKDRLRTISAHFIVAFLDRTLKGDESRAAYLKPIASGSLAPGFQPRWSLGFSLRQDSREQP